jgi:hypothetical protein
VTGWDGGGWMGEGEVGWGCGRGEGKGRKGGVGGGVSDVVVVG